MLDVDVLLLLGTWQHRLVVLMISLLRTVTLVRHYYTALLTKCLAGRYHLKPCLGGASEGLETFMLVMKADICNLQLREFVV